MSHFPLVWEYLESFAASGSLCNLHNPICVFWPNLFLNGVGGLWHEMQKPSGAIFLLIVQTTSETLEIAHSVFISVVTKAAG